MDFEDRLRNQLHGQSNNIEVEIDSPVAVAHRSATRTRRRMVGLPVAALMLAGIVGGGLWASQDQDGGTESVALVGDESTDDEAPTEGDTDAEAETANSGSTNAGPVDLDQLITQGFSPGPELVFDDVSSAKSPGGWGPTEVHGNDGIYYVLSTAPGRPAPAEPGDYISFRPDTLYTYDGSAWSINGFGDRLVADFDVSDDGVLYAVSTGTTTDVAEFALGQSTDGGESWAWNALPSDGHDPATLAPRFATRGDTTLIVSQLPFRQNFGAAAELARSAGLEINDYDITSVSTVGIGWVEHLVSGDPCEAVERMFWDEAEFNGPFEGEDIPEDPDEAEAAFERYYLEQETALYAALREAGCGQVATCRQISSDFYRDDNNQLPPPPLPSTGIDIASDATSEVVLEMTGEFDRVAEEFFNERQEALDQLLIEGGCEQEVTCRNISMTFAEEGGIQPPFDAPAPPNPELLTDEQLEAAEAEWNEYAEKSDAWYLENQDLIEATFASHQAALEAAGCDSMMAPEAPEPKFVEWSSLGVTPPADWTTTLVQIVGPAGVQTSELDPGSYIFDVKVEGDEFVLIAARDFGPISPMEPIRNDEWRSLDGLNWTRTEGGVADAYNSAVVNGQHFTLAWEEGRRDPVLRRAVVGNPATQDIELTDLDPDLPADLVPEQISGSPFGVVIVAFERTYMTRPTEAYVLFSPDGIRWSSQRIDSSARLPFDGADSMMLFGSQLDPNSTEPSAVYIGRVDG